MRLSTDGDKCSIRRRGILRTYEIGRPPIRLRLTGTLCRAGASLAPNESDAKKRPEPGVWQRSGLKGRPVRFLVVADAGTLISFLCIEAIWLGLVARS